MATKAEAEERLRRLQAFWVADIDDQHELWGTPWGFFFWVPMAGPFRDLDDDVLADIEADVRQSKP